MMEFSSTWVFSPPHRVFFFQNLRWNPSIEVVILGKADLAFASSRPSNYCRAWLAAKTKMKIFSPNKKRGSGCIEVFPIIYRFFCHPRWGRNFSINSMSDQFLFLLLFALKAMKVAKTLPEVRGFWKVTWPLNLDFHLRSYDLQVSFFCHLPSHLTAGFVCGRKLRPFQNWRKKSRRRRCAIAGLGYIFKGYPTPMPPPQIITP